METIKEAKQYLRNNFEKGVDCPCCGQFVKRYKRKLNSGMSRTLIALYKAEGKNPVNVKAFLRENNIQNNHDWTLLRYWKLLIEHENDDPDKKSSGVWSITNKGIGFLMNKVKVPSHILLFDNKFIGYSPTETDVVDSLGKHFNYTELMNA